MIFFVTMRNENQNIVIIKKKKILSGYVYVPVQIYQFQYHHQKNSL